jgi:hypothetical protein
LRPKETYGSPIAGRFALGTIIPISGKEGSFPENVANRRQLLAIAEKT